MTKTEECGSCTDDSCSAKAKRPGEQDKDYIERQQLAQRMCRIKHKIIVLSGKGGVGKSTVAVNLAVSLSLQGKKVGLLDIDIHGPSVPHVLGLVNERPVSNGVALQPIEMNENLKVFSVGFMFEDKDAAIIWRGPMKHNAIKQFIKDVDWGDLDFLIVDSPPGTGDEPLSIIQLLEDATGAIVVTTPQDVALADVRKSITFCHQLDLPILGVVENMSGFICPTCKTRTDIFKTGGGKSMAHEMGVSFLGSISLDPDIADACDAGKPYIDHYAETETAKEFNKIVSSILKEGNVMDVNIEKTSKLKKGERRMRIAIPTAEGKLAMHFGHCEQFAIIDVNGETREVLKIELETPPPHEPGVLPKWLAEKKVNVIIGGGMGSRAQNLFAEQDIEVVVGASADTPEKIVMAYMDGSLQTGGNVCDH